MASPGGGMTVLPQFQGDYYNLQNRQALAQAMMSQAMANQTPAAGAAVGPYQVQARYNLGAGASQLAQAYMAAKMQNQVAQGYNALGQQQWQYLTGNGGGSNSPLQSAPADQFGNAGAAGVPSGPQQPAGGGSGPVAPQVASPQPQGQQPPPQAPQQPQQGLLAPGSSWNPGGMPVNQAAMLYMQMGPQEYAKQFVAPYYQPTDIAKQMRLAGIDPNSALGRQVAQQAVAKANYIPPTSIRPGGGILDPQTGRITTLPAAAPEGFQNVQDPNTGQWSVQPVAGGTSAVAASSQAKASGPASFNVQKVYNPATQQYEYQPATNIAGAANGAMPGGAPAGNPALPLPLRNNNPGAVSPGGQVAHYPDMQTGIAAMDQTLQGYGKQGVNTLGGVISKWAPPGQNNTPAYIQDVTQRLGIPANQPVDLTNPAQRLAISSAIMLHENGSRGVFAPSAGAPPAATSSGAMAASPGLGATNAANASQTAPSAQMAAAQGGLSDADSTYQQSRENLQQMIQLAQQKGTSGAVIGATLPEGIATRISPQAAEYAKLHASYVANQGKALGSSGTDASRATIDEAVPTYDKPQTAMLSGLNTQLNQLDLTHMKRQFLTPLYQQGNEKAYTAQSAAFDNNISPSMMPVLQLPGPQRQAAVQAAIKANPSVRPNYEWAFNNGLLQ